MAVVKNNLGTMVGWHKVTARLLGRDLVGVRKIAYSDETEIENEYGVGQMPVGESEGNYKAEASIEITIEEALLLQRALPPGKRLQDIPAFDITVAYEYQGQIITDRLRNCRFMGRGVDVSQGDKTIARDYTIKTSHINWNVWHQKK